MSCNKAVTEHDDRHTLDLWLVARQGCHSARAVVWRLSKIQYEGMAEDGGVDVGETFRGMLKECGGGQFGGGSGASMVLVVPRGWNCIEKGGGQVDDSRCGCSQ